MKRCFAGIWTTIALSIFAVSWHLSAQEDQELSSVGDDVVLRLHIPDIARSLQRLEQHPFRTLVTETDEGAIRGRWRQWMAMVEPLLGEEIGTALLSARHLQLTIADVVANEGSVQIRLRLEVDLGPHAQAMSTHLGELLGEQTVLDGADAAWQSSGGFGGSAIVARYGSFLVVGSTPALAGAPAQGSQRPDDLQLELNPQGFMVALNKVMESPVRLQPGLFSKSKRDRQCL